MQVKKVHIDPNVTKLVEHKNNKKIKFNGQYIVYEKDGVIACDRGLTTFLSLFSKGYKRPNNDDVKQHCDATGTKMVTKRNIVRVGDPWEKVDQMDASKTGRMLGTYVHNQMCLYARARNEKQFKQVCPNPHDYTKRAIEKLKSSGISVFFAEFAIVDPMVKYVTSIDLIGVNSSGKLTLVELKTGSENIFPIGKVPFASPFDKWENSLLNQARLQLLLPCLTLKYQYGVNVDSAWVLNVNSSQEELYPLESSMVVGSRNLYKHLVDTYGANAKPQRSITLKQRKKTNTTNKTPPKRKRVNTSRPINRVTPSPKRKKQKRRQPKSKKKPRPRAGRRKKARVRRTKKV